MFALLSMVRFPVTIETAAVTLNLLDPATCKSIRLPVKPEAALPPSSVPLVLQPADVVPDGSMSIKGFVVVADPPVKIVPVSDSAGVLAAPLTDKMLAAVNVCAMPSSAKVSLPLTAGIVKVRLAVRAAVVIDAM